MSSHEEEKENFLTTEKERIGSLGQVAIRVMDFADEGRTQIRKHGELKKTGKQILSRSLLKDSRLLTSRTVIEYNSVILNLLVHSTFLQQI